MGLDAFLTPRSDEFPSGENLEYDSDFTALELAAQPGQERQAGDEIIAAEEPNHKEVVEKALTVLARSHDLRAAVYLARARLALDGLDGLAEVMSYVRGCLENYWDTCHPQLDADDDSDPTMRINAVLGLANTDTILRGLRLAPLTDSPTFGQFCLRDVSIAEGEIAAPEGSTGQPDQATISAAFKDTKTDKLASRLAAARQILDDTVAINAVFDTQTPGDGPNLDALLRMAKRIVSRLAAVAGEPETAAVGGPESVAEATALAATRTAPGVVNTQADVRAALDRIIDYYRKNEPSSPLPLLLERARRLVGADFMSIVKDIAPNGLDNVMTVGGIEEVQE